MSILKRGYLKRVAIGLAASIAIGLTTVLTHDIIWAISGGFPITPIWREETSSQVLIACAPFLVLSVCGIGARRPWIVGLCLTGALWGYYLWDSTHYKGGGANIGLGILMIFSPILITGACLFAYATSAERRIAGGKKVGR